jgi:hypothetical protein
MKVAFIPPRGLESYALHSRFHLALALPELLQRAAYTDVYQRAANGGDFIIVDNGEAEGNRCSPQQLLDAARVLRASEIVLPDVIGDGPDTYKRAKKFVDKYGEEVQGYSLMAVAQGDNISKFMACIDLLATIPGVTTIGLPRHSLSRCRSTAARIDLANWIRETYRKKFAIHFLGVAPTYLPEIKWAAKYAAHVRSIDSSAPFNYAMNKELLTSMKTVVRPERYFEKNWSMAVPRDLVLENIRIMKEWASDRGAPPPPSEVRELSAEHPGDEVRPKFSSTES